MDDLCRDIQTMQLSTIHHIWAQLLVWRSKMGAKGVSFTKETPNWFTYASLNGTPDVALAPPRIICTSHARDMPCGIVGLP